MPLTQEQIAEQEAVKLEEMERLVNQVIKIAEDEGFVVTIETVPGTPLAMRNYYMFGNVRRAR